MENLSAMRGILWRWLFSLGAIFWISLCLADYHQKYLRNNFKLNLQMDMKIAPQSHSFMQIIPRKREQNAPTPALTFWKFLSILLSVGAIVIIKRLSNLKNNKLPVTSCSDFDLNKPHYDSFITRVPQITTTPIYRQERVIPQEMKKPLVKVKIVQKKLEDLENNIATLKQRISSSSTSKTSTATSESVKKVFERKLGCSLTSKSPTETPSSVSTTPKSSESKTRKEVLRNHSKPVTPVPSIIPAVTLPDIDKSIRKVAFSLKEVTLINSDKPTRKEMSLNDVKMSRNKPSIEPLNNKEMEYKSSKIHEKLKNELSLNEHPKQKIPSRNKSPTNSIAASKHVPESKSTLSSVSIQKSQDATIKSFSLDTPKVYSDKDSVSSASTITNVTLKRKRFLKSLKDRSRNNKFNYSKSSTSNYLTPNMEATFFAPRLRFDHSSYAEINTKKAHLMKHLKANASKIKRYDQISMSSSNDSTDSIEKFVAKILKPDSDTMLNDTSSGETSMASTSISSLAASTSTFISGGKQNESVNSIRSILPLSKTTVGSKISSLGNSRNIPGGAEPLSSKESLIDSNVSNYGTSLAIHSLAMNYLHSLELNKLESESQDLMRDSSSEFSFTTKSVLEKYKSKTQQSDANTSRQNILEDKYWLLHW